MKEYMVRLYTSVESAWCQIEAKTPQQALQRARKLRREQLYELDFWPNDDAAPVEYIRVLDESRFVLEWCAPERSIRLAAGDLLAALEKALTALNAAPRFPVPGLDSDSYDVAALCDRAIRLAKERG